MSHSDKSVRLTLFVVRALSAVFLILLFAFPFIFKPLFSKIGLENQFTVFLITFYACGPAAGVTLYCLNRLLVNIRKGVVFNAVNTMLLKTLSISCLAAAILSVPVCFYIPIMTVFPLEAGFMSLILHVVKNVIEKGSEIKDENDLTI